MREIVDSSHPRMLNGRLRKNRFSPGTRRWIKVPGPGTSNAGGRDMTIKKYRSLRSFFSRRVDR